MLQNLRLSLLPSTTWEFFWCVSSESEIQFCICFYWFQAVIWALFHDWQVICAISNILKNRNMCNNCILIAFVWINDSPLVCKVRNISNHHSDCVPFYFLFWVLGSLFLFLWKQIEHLRCWHVL